MKWNSIEGSERKEKSCRAIRLSNTPYHSSFLSSPPPSLCSTVIPLSLCLPDEVNALCSKQATITPDFQIGLEFFEICYKCKQRKGTHVFLISNIRLALNVVFLLLGYSPASEFYMPTFRNTLFQLHGWYIH